MSEPELVTNFNFKGKEYLLKILTTKNKLEISVLNKYTGEEWQCGYDSSYIENLTHKTGNYKQFDVFIQMLKSGLLKTSKCVTLELLTFKDLELLRMKKHHQPLRSDIKNVANRRYLILTYTVEFDRIHYPLPLEFIGPPDPQIQQATIRKLEDEVLRLQDLLENSNSYGDQRELVQCKHIISKLQAENMRLKEQIVYYKKLGCTAKEKLYLENALKGLENQVLNERTSHHRLVKKLREDKSHLLIELNKSKESEYMLRSRLKIRSTSNSPSRLSRRNNSFTEALRASYTKSCPIVTKSNGQNHRSRKDQVFSNHNSNKYHSISPKPVRDIYNARHDIKSSSRSCSQSSRKSRGSSSESKSVYMMKSANDIMTIQSPFTKCRTPNRSRNSSRSSIKSRSPSLNYNFEKVAFVNKKRQDSSIENRILDLQKLLNQNLPFK